METTSGSSTTYFLNWSDGSRTEVRYNGQVLTQDDRFDSPIDPRAAGCEGDPDSGKVIDVPGGFFWHKAGQGETAG